jgi:hypothetical protein
MVGIPFRVRKQKQILGNSFRTNPRKRKQLVIPFHGRNKEENSRNSDPKLFEVRTNHFVKLFGCFVKQIFSANLFPHRASKLNLPWSLECLGRNTFFLGITETIPSLSVDELKIRRPAFLCLLL